MSNIEKKKALPDEIKKNLVKNEGDGGFAIPKENYKLIFIGLVVIVLGFVLMAGGGSDDPNVFNEAEIFSFRRITLSTIIVIAGFVFEIYAIMRKPKDNSTEE